MMNRIIVDRNRLENYQSDAISIQNGRIIFYKSGDYTLEYLESDFVKLDIIILDQVMVKLFVWSVDQTLQVDVHYKLGKYSNLILFQFYYNKFVKEQVVFDLDGEYSKISSNFSSISKNDEEYHIIVNHNQHHVTSAISNKCIGLDKSKIFFQIDSVLEKGNTDCVMDQNTRILTMGDVLAKIEPNMFIEEDSVEAKHGSIIGSFQEEDVFYLMSRGIDREEAIMLLVKGYLFSNLVVDMEKRAKILECIQEIGR